MKKNPAFVLREVGGKSLLIPICKNDIGNDPIDLNSTAKIIWDNVIEGDTKDDLLMKISKLYNLADSSDEQMAVKEFIEHLIKLQLVSMDQK